MQPEDSSPVHPALRSLVAEACQALARLDVERLDELALSVQILNRDLHGDMPPERRAALASEAQGAAGDMAVFARVIEATRANVDVMNRLRELRTGRLEYGQRGELGSPASRSRSLEIGLSRSGHGND
jgi:hypothetical protein